MTKKAAWNAIESALCRGMNRSFRDALYVLRNDKLALQTTWEAVALWDVTTTSQDKELKAYAPKKYRTKVQVSEHHILQWLTYTKSLCYEQTQEADGIANEGDLRTRYIKHAAGTILRSNSFRAAIAVSRIIHNYSTEETRHIYNGVIQNDAKRQKAACEYRNVKGALLAGLKQRFGELLRTERVEHGEERVVESECTPQTRAHAREALSVFTPWDTPCVLLGPDGLKGLSSLGNHPDAEHDLEVTRIHTLLCPHCFSRLTQHLGLAPPETRLCPPQFTMPTRSLTDDHALVRNLTEAEVRSLQAGRTGRGR